MAKEIPLSRGFVALVDDEDYRELARHKWSVNGAGRYASRNNKQVDGKRVSPGAILMHRQILNAPGGMEVDHINGNGLDNRRSNLRLCTHSQNGKNARQPPGRALFRGVEPHQGKYRARICVDGRRVHFWPFETPIEAARAYDAAAKRPHGEFAVLNGV